MSLFARLFKYHATEGRSPQEDFLTEALAGVLESSLRLRVVFVKWVLELDVETVSVETQKHVETETRMDEGETKRRLDLWIEAREGSGARHVVVFENKIGAPEGDGQLQSYEGYLRKYHKQAASRTLIYLTPQTQSDFQPTDARLVAFRELRWFQVFNWMKTWAQDPEVEAGSAALVKELLALMEEWNLTTELNASDLAAAVAHRSSVEQRMLQLLNEVWDACNDLTKRDGGNWSYRYRKLYYESPWFVGDGGDFYFSFGFDFDREDDVWSVSSLRLPSAYFGVADRGAIQLDWDTVSSDWVQPPEEWKWGTASRVKRLSCLRANGDSLDEGYREFFKEALGEARQVARL
ncbi:MAG: hypothetical protein F4X81_07900 [Gammaproteobacteria bacterium]|nr:hypothetical protein [Gammaproteobacteria bacterium]MYE51377.1 hypothetical protein [Gammaproteobacteria bacterium]